VRRGHGRSTSDSRPYGYDPMADDVVAMMDVLKVPKADIVGWSDGAILGLAMPPRKRSSAPVDRAQSAELVAPPSTTISMPVRMAESSEARYKTAFATSSASLNLPSGMDWLTRCSNSFSASSVGTIREQIGVRVTPGVT
jgi:pimeloyl-ACP methyl ester carboxylesterase